MDNTMNSLIRCYRVAEVSYLIYLFALPLEFQFSFISGDEKKEQNLFVVQAARILANLLVVGSGIMVRALSQAYRQALANASRNGVSQDAVQNIKRVSKIMAEPEARQVLGVTKHSSSWEEIMKKYDNLFEKNAKNGSFYLQSKVHRAKECLEVVYRMEAQRSAVS
ncbi:protein Transporter, Pam16 [Actinidia rufa]|uniref:Protein Transporter, Pam16 n=1 Tax=Actinidia rufa TaxID=165716 RepID=A0A7J0FZ29_9ERIC|nr:protein Transporter, Pam16 [Actinidia rufa]